MTTNAGPKGGKKQRRGGRKKKDFTCEIENDSEIYAIVKNKTGGSHIAVITIDGQELRPRIPGKFFKKGGAWLKAGDFVVIVRGDSNISEIKGFVTENKMASVKKDFEQAGSDNKGIKALISFSEAKLDDNSDDSDSDSDSNSSSDSDSDSKDNNKNGKNSKNSKDNKEGKDSKPKSTKPLTKEEIKIKANRETKYNLDDIDFDAI